MDINGSLVLFEPRVVFAMLLVTLLLSAACGKTPRHSKNSVPSASAQESVIPAEPVAIDDFARQRQAMVAEQLAGRDIVNRRVLQAMRSIPRHTFVPESLREQAYDDYPLPIGLGQTISQPYIVALMTQLGDPQPHHKALDVGTGSGYQAAVLAELVQSVYSVEIVEPLARQAEQRLRELGYQNITVRAGDGYHGWPAEAPFDVIIVAAAPDHVPPALVDQLAMGGKLVIPIGDYFQTLRVIEKGTDGTVVERDIAPVAFVPMTGAARH